MVFLKALNSDLVNTELSSAPTVDPTVVRLHLNKRHVRAMAPVSKEKKVNATAHKYSHC